jgi:hypothetical protein
MLIIDHYTYGYPDTFFRKRIRRRLLKKDAKYAFNYSENLVKKLYPFHKKAWKLKKIPVFKLFCKNFLSFFLHW